MVEAGHVGRPFHIGVRWLGGRWAEETAPANQETPAAETKSAAAPTSEQAALRPAGCARSSAVVAASADDP